VGKFVAAGTDVGRHVTVRSAADCIAFALAHVRSAPDLSAVEADLFSILTRYDYTGVPGARADGIDRQSSRDSLHSMVSTDRGGSVSGSSVTQSKKEEKSLPSAPVGAAAAQHHQSAATAKRGPRQMGTITVKDKLDILLTSNGVAAAALPDGDEGGEGGGGHMQPKRPAVRPAQGKGGTGRFKFLADARINGASPPPGADAANKMSSLLHKMPRETARPPAVESLFETVRDIFDR
jgi:hypothetical protein